jgi:hypothetical protein
MRHGTESLIGQAPTRRPTTTWTGRRGIHGEDGDSVNTQVGLSYGCRACETNCYCKPMNGYEHELDVPTRHGAIEVEGEK